MQYHDIKSACKYLCVSKSTFFRDYRPYLPERRNGTIVRFWQGDLDAIQNGCDIQEGESLVFTLDRGRQAEKAVFGRDLCFTSKNRKEPKRGISV